MNDCFRVTSFETLFEELKRKFLLLFSFSFHLQRLLSVSPLLYPWLMSLWTW